MGASLGGEADVRARQSWALAPPPASPAGRLAGIGAGAPEGLVRCLAEQVALSSWSGTARLLQSPAGRHARRLQRFECEFVCCPRGDTSFGYRACGAKALQ